MTSASQKPAGRSAFADNIRQPEEMKNALIWLFDTDASQLAGFLRSGPAAGRTKLLLACARAVCKPPNPAPASSDSPPVAPTSNDAATVPPASVASDVNAAPAASADAAPDTKEPQHDGTGASIPTDADKAGDSSFPTASPGGADDSLHPPGAPAMADASSAQPGPSATDGASPAPSRFDHVAPPTFLETSEIPRKAKVSTRQVLCCRETCSICFQACCGYSSELPRDSHFESADVHHRCKSCYRASRANKTADAPSSTSTSYA